MSARSKFDQQAIATEPSALGVRAVDAANQICALTGPLARSLAAIPVERRIHIRWPGTGAADKHDRGRTPERSVPAKPAFAGTVH